MTIARPVLQKPSLLTDLMDASPLFRDAELRVRKYEHESDFLNSRIPGLERALAPALKKLGVYVEPTYANPYIEAIVCAQPENSMAEARFYQSRAEDRIRANKILGELSLLRERLVVVRRELGVAQEQRDAILAEAEREARQTKGR